MRKLLLLILSAIYCLSAQAQAPNTWVTKASFGGTARSASIGFSIGQKGYLGTGNQRDDFWEYDPATDTWSQKANFGGGTRSAAVGFSIGNKGYVGTGSGANGLYKKDFWEYDPVGNTWTQKSDFPGTARANAIGFSIGSLGYVGTGIRSNTSGSVFTLFDDFWEFNPTTNTWLQKASIPGNERWAAVGFTINSKGYVGLGSDNTGFKNDLREYNPATNTWTTKATFGGAARNSAVAFVLGTKAFVGTGLIRSPFNSTYKTADIWQYDPVTNTWIQKPSIPGLERDGAVAFNIGSKGYLGTGTTIFGESSSFFEYTPDFTVATTALNSSILCPGASLNIAFTLNGIPEMPYAGNIFTAQLSDKYGSFATPTVLGTLNGTTAGTIVTTIPANTPNGNAYRIRVVSSTPVASIIIDNGTNMNVGSPGDKDTWTQKASFGGGSRQEAVSFSIGSKGYLGTGEFGFFKDDFWEYDPVTDTWSQKANFAGGLRKGAVGFSIGSKGYVGTGLDNSRNYKNDFWEYNPLTNTWTQKANFIGSARISAVGFSIGTKGYIGTGYANVIGPSNTFYEYNPATDTWLSRANVPGPARERAVGFSIGAKGYIGTGNSNSGARDDFWEYDPITNAWTMKADFAGGPIIEAVGFSIGSKGYLGTGFGSTGEKSFFYEYDPALDTWSQITDIGGDTRSGAVAFSIGAKGYVGIGSNSTQGYARGFWEYTTDKTPEIVVISGSTTICSSGSLVLSISSPVPGATYQWSLNGMPIQGETNPTYTASSAGDYSITVTGACFSATSAATTVAISPVPAVPNITASRPITFCTGDSVVLTANSASSGATFTWFKDGNIIPGANSATFTVKNSGQYSAIATSGSCSSAASASTLITVNPIPVPVISGLKSAYCQSEAAVTLTGTPSGSTFTIDGVASSTLDPGNLSVGTHTIVISNTNGGCTGTATQQILINAAPAAPVLSSAGPITFCSGSSVTLTASSNTPGGMFEWYLNGNLITGANSASYIANSAGAFTTVAKAGGCLSLPSAAINVTVKGVPGSPSISQSGNVLISGSATGNQWYLNGVAIPGATNQNYTVTANGSYTVVVTVNGCSSSPSAPINVTTTGLGESKSALAIGVFPNPSSGIFSVKVKGNQNVARLELYNLAGQLITTEQLSAGEEEKQFNVKNQASGIYLLKVTREDVSKVLRVVLEK
ncbi:Ig-like domain-containing protein [Adhaeribacter soli]|uniref:T9SS type A sorting domain-containing protein n=1 Tax=Adhaeribacter soli TaxID=2607655 RepID=A0A5N1IKS0_9BACT|nr:T9SS type A sorting domain-containing protein [Adhaeribacter soli]KAA9325989.1 T9SS type A sorting domain-containing protein [Adhaeribacter soli]